MSDDLKVESWAYFRTHRKLAWTVAVSLTLIIGFLDFTLPREIPLLLAYLVPIAIIGAVSSRMYTLFAALFCTAVSEWTDAYVWNAREGIVRDLVTLIALAAVGLYVREFITKQEQELQHVKVLEKENAARIEAEEQLSLLIGNSALAILTMTAEGTILEANNAAQRMFSGSQDAVSIVGRQAGELLPPLARVMERSAKGQSIRTMMQVQGTRMDGEPFLAEVWFSNYSTSIGMRTAAMVVDISEEFRSREESVAEQLLSNSRLAVGAMAHEMRNLFGAIQAITQSLVHESPEFAQQPLVAPLRDLLVTLESMASVQLSQVRRSAARVSLNQFASELRVIAQAALLEHGIAFRWEVGADLPSVWADSDGLMQVFLNLLRNAKEALAHTVSAEVHIASVLKNGRVEITVGDNGPGVADPAKLFHPFHGTHPMPGLGLYISRALLTSYRGDLRFIPSSGGARFVVDLEVVAA